MVIRGDEGSSGSEEGYECGQGSSKVAGKLRTSEKEVRAR